MGSVYDLPILSFDASSMLSRNVTHNADCFSSTATTFICPPGSHCSSTHSAICAMTNASSAPAPSHCGSTQSLPDSSIPPPPLPLSSPPALEPARIYHHSSPPDSPPPLAPATLPATAHHHHLVHAERSSSPEAYSPIIPQYGLYRWSYDSNMSQQQQYTYSSSYPSLSSYSHNDNYSSRSLSSWHSISHVSNLQHQPVQSRWSTSTISSTLTLSHLHSLLSRTRGSLGGKSALDHTVACKKNEHAFHVTSSKLRLSITFQQLHEISLYFA
ncbi:hypothetical protein BDQ17DRAFT_1429074 [Cyathus striatus]|nr:hypothetical protein BDQ17DRAFT_1429074 [Cyathus striatus]